MTPTHREQQYLLRSPEDGELGISCATLASVALDSAATGDEDVRLIVG